MAFMRHPYYGRHHSPRIPHFEQLVLHATILTLALTVVLVKLVG